MKTGNDVNSPKPEPEPAMPFVLEALRRLSECRLRYCVLRNYRSLPRGLNGTDLDLLVETGDLEAAFRILCEAAKRHGGVFISHYRGEALITSFCGRDAGVWWGVPIDVFPGLTHRGVPFYDAGGLLQRAQDWHGIPVAPDGEASMIALLKELLTNASSRKDYDKQATAEHAANPVLYDQRLGGPFGPGAVAAFRKYLDHNDSVTLMRTAACRLRWALFWRAFRRHPVRLLATKVVGLGRRLRRLFHPPGILLAVVGTGDAGRSALIARVQPVLQAAVHGHVHLRHFRPGLSPSKGRYGGAPKAETPAAGPHARRPSGSLRSFLRLAYCALDYCLGYWATVYPSLVKRPSIWIFDGYFDDFLLDPLRVGVALPEWVMKCVAIIVPKPDIVINLGGWPDGIRSGRLEPLPVELNPATLRRAVCRSDTRAVWIEANGTDDDNADRVISAVVAWASARYSSR